MADNTAVTDNTSQAPAKTTAPDFSAYLLDRPTAPSAPTADQTPQPSGTKDSTDLTVPPLWKTPEADAPKAPGTPADSNLQNSAENKMEGQQREDINQGQENILNAAKDSVGKELWKGTKHERVVAGGKLGAAVSVSEVLKASGITESVDSASIAGVEQQMKDAGFVQKGLADADPGDVIVYQPSESNPSKRIGIVGDNNDQGKPTIYQMDRNGTWRHHEMRVPANGNTKVYTPGCGE